jgi:hypothetical protein
MESSEEDPYEGAINRLHQTLAQHGLHRDINHSPKVDNLVKAPRPRHEGRIFPLTEYAVSQVWAIDKAQKALHASRRANITINSEEDRHLAINRHLDAEQQHRQTADAYRQELCHGLEFRAGRDKGSAASHIKKHERWADYHRRQVGHLWDKGVHLDEKLAGSNKKTIWVGKLDFNKPVYADNHPVAVSFAKEFIKGMRSPYSEEGEQFLAKNELSYKVWNKPRAGYKFYQPSLGNSFEVDMVPFGEGSGMVHTVRWLESSKEDS